VKKNPAINEMNTKVAILGAGCSSAYGYPLANQMAERSRRFFHQVLRFTPESRVHRGVLLASTTPAATPVGDVAKALGCGELVTAPDTVPFCIWVAAHYLDNFVEALAQTIRVGGDCDTNAAIIGGIVVLSAGRESIPQEWLEAREPIHV